FAFSSLSYIISILYLLSFSFLIFIIFISEKFTSFFNFLGIKKFKLFTLNFSCIFFDIDNFSVFPSHLIAYFVNVISIFPEFLYLGLFGFPLILFSPFSYFSFKAMYDLWSLIHFIIVSCNVCECKYLECQ